MNEVNPAAAKPPFRQIPDGFGLIEQIVTLIVLAILLLAAIPAFRHLLDQYELRQAQTDYIAALQHARSLAVNEQMRIVFCPSHDALTCNGDNHWNDGWLIGRDPHKTGQPDGVPLYVGGAHSSRLNIIGTSSLKQVQFQWDGTLGNTNQSLVFCLRGDDSQALAVAIARRGRIRGSTATRDQAAQCAASE
jgi:type IV fimbrial biogenesis protein FimT